MKLISTAQTIRDKHVPQLGRRVALGAMMALGLVVLGGGILTSSAQSAMDSVKVSQQEFFFNPNLVTMPADTAVEFTITNSGAIRHNFSITDHGNPGLKNLNISFDTDPGKSGTATVNAPAGVYYFYCNEPGHEQQGMFGYITVQKDAQITTSEATVTPRAG